MWATVRNMPAMMVSLCGSRVYMHHSADMQSAAAYIRPNWSLKTCNSSSRTMVPGTTGSESTAAYDMLNPTLPKVPV